MGKRQIRRIIKLAPSTAVIFFFSVEWENGEEFFGSLETARRISKSTKSRTTEICKIGQFESNLRRVLKMRKIVLASSRMSHRLSIYSSLRLSVHPSVRLYGTTTIPLDRFSWIWYFSIFRKSIEKIKVSLKSEKNNVIYWNTNVHIWSYLMHFFLKW